MRGLDNLKAIKKLDASGMLDLLMQFPQQLDLSKKRAKMLSVPTSYRRAKSIVFAGMGGSAIGGELVCSFLKDKSLLPTSVNRNYSLPKFVDKDSLFFACSYSGNTEETLAAYKLSLQRKAKVIAISSGGKLKKLALKDKTPFIEIPSGFPPRAAIGYLSIIPLYILNKLGVMDDPSFQIEEAILVLEKLRDESLSPKIKIAKNFAKKVACELYDKFIIIYGPSSGIDTCVNRLRSQLSENAKCLASVNFLPEMNHNELMGWERRVRFFPKLVVVMLKDRYLHRKLKKRFEITKAIIEKRSVKIIEIDSRGISLLARVFSLIYIGDFISFYLSILNGIDPTPVKTISYLKKRLL